MRVPYVDLGGQFTPHMDQYLAKVREVLSDGYLILGPEVTTLEESFAKYCGTKYAVGVANGTDSLVMIMRGLGIGPGDEVITAPNSYLASASSVAMVGATPIFADVQSDMNIAPAEIEKKISTRTKAIMPVHLTGRPADMDKIMEIAERHNVHIIEDAAQAVGAEYKSKRVGSFGIANSFSLHPLKNLGAAGDAGIITTNNENLYQYLCKARTHGMSSRDKCEFWSNNSRIDALQAAFLNIKMRFLDKWNEERRKNAQIYIDRLKDYVCVPADDDLRQSVYHAFVIQTDRRDELMQFLKDREIDTKIHYPIPIHLQESAKYLGNQPGSYPETEKQITRILSLPVFPELSEIQVNYVADSIIEFFTGG